MVEKIETRGECVMMFRQLFCKHVWDKRSQVSHVVRKSRAETLIRMGAKNLSKGVPMTSTIRISTKRCEKCGKIERYLENV
jgi:hypothetical protein